MTIPNQLRTITRVLLAAACLVIGSQRGTADDLAAKFSAPADACKPHTWWHWMNGHVTKDAVTRDLEDMKRIGLGGFTLWNTQEGTPEGPVKYASEEWWALLEHTMNEAERLGLEMGIFNGAGWSSTGAAFVTPDKAMQEVAWTEARAQGPGKIKMRLTVPTAALGIERDMKKHPVINRRYYMPREHVDGWFKDIAVYAVPAVPEGQKLWTLTDWRNKAAFGKMPHRFQPDGRQAPSDQVIAPDQILDVSRFMNADGELEWEAPAGNWTILRMGYQPTGRGNHPASHGGRGLEIDKMSAEAMDFYWENFLNRVVKTAGKRIPGTFNSISLDSYEVGHQNWNKDFPQSFIAATGYDLREFLPVVAGRVVGSVEFSERVLWDYRKVVGDLIAKNYFGRMAERCHAAGLKFANEPYGSYGNTNDFTVAGTVDIPTCEWWAYHSSQLGRPAETKLAASAAHTYGRKMVDSEAFTGTPERIFETHPGGIKAQGDYFMTLGVNRFSFHTWAHDPYGVAPGLGLGTYGSRFDNRNTWWPFAKPWHDYLSRCFCLLQQGEFVGDVLYFAGEEAPLNAEGLRRDKILSGLPHGIDYAFANTEILGQLRFEKEQLKTLHGSGFRVLVLPDSPWVSVEVLEKVAALLAGGAVVTGPKPQSLPGKPKPGDMAKFQALVKSVWGDCDGRTILSNKVGKGTLHCGIPIDQVLAKHGIQQDVCITRQAGESAGTTLYPATDIEFIHRRSGSDEIYFLSNQNSVATSVTATFRVTGKVPEIWMPDSGNMYQLLGVKTENGSTQVGLHFDSGEACFVVFRDAHTATAAPPWSQPEKAVTDLSQGWMVEFPNRKGFQMPELVSWPVLKDDLLKYHSGTATYQKTFTMDAVADKSRLMLDLGDVQVIASVSVNGKDCGIAWKRPYQVDVTEALKPGDNMIAVTVANLWVNRIIGDQRHPDDVEWTSETGSTAAGQGLAGIPDWVKNRTRRPNPDRKAFYGWKWPHMTADRKLLPSGLLGPVLLRERSGEPGR
jgi:hypothetical protein